MSISVFMRIKATAALGVAPSRSKRAHPCLNVSSASLLGAKNFAVAPVPQDCSITLMKASNLSGGNTHEGKWP
jgi:hypothetical protein